ncbi:MAG: hypothetical protein HYZ53_09130 [Planctomycetes bacterium]|nr:hypothetical protein [Planctomycetota bacterium]
MSDPADHAKYGKSLASEERTLIVLRDELYGGSWDKMLQDLSDRLRGKPYIFKLVNRIKQDIARIEVLKKYEEQHGINLSNFLPDED